MTTDVTSLGALNEGLIRLQKSARKTIPMFLIGILATIMAAGIGVYYILTLSADLRDARHALQRSEAALTEARANLAAVSVSLRKAQTAPNSRADRSSIATALADVARSQAVVLSASTSIKDATEKLDPAGVASRQAAPQPSAIRDAVTAANAAELSGSFEVVPTSDHYLVLRTQPSVASSEIRRIPTGGLLQCGMANPNESGNLWRPCTDDQGNSGFVSNKFIRKH